MSKFSELLYQMMGSSIPVPVKTPFTIKKGIKIKENAK
jgi:hypothetical protein